MSFNCHLNLQLQILTPAVLNYVKDETKLDATRAIYCYNEVEPGSDSNWSASYSDWFISRIPTTLVRTAMKHMLSLVSELINQTRVIQKSHCQHQNLYF